MVSLQICKEFIAVSCGRRLRVFSSRESGSHLKEEDLTIHDDGCDADEGISKDDRTSDPNQMQRSGQIVCCRFSWSGKYLCCIDDCKILHLWQTTPFKLLSKRTIQKRCTGISFSHSEREILVADKFGDVYRFSAEEPEQEGELILGHVSMILDLAVTPDDKFIITCDRDEKIRISSFPNGYNIHGYCLGHTEFVSRCKILPNHPNILVSAGGDDSLRLWDIERCSEISSLHISHESPRLKSGEHHTVTHLCCSSEEYVAIALLGESVVLIYQLQDEPSCQLTEVESLKLDASVLCVTFDSNGFLWVIQGSPAETVQVFRVDCDADIKVKRVEAVSEPWQTAVLSSISSDWDSLKGALVVDNPLASLHKRSYDNIKEYLEKKQERVEKEEIRKEKHEARKARQEQRKRMKMEDSGT